MINWIMAGLILVVNKLTFSHDDLGDLQVPFVYLELLELLL